MPTLTVNLQGGDALVDRVRREVARYLFEAAWHEPRPVAERLVAYALLIRDAPDVLDGRAEAPA